MILTDNKVSVSKRAGLQNKNTQALGYEVGGGGGTEQSKLSAKKGKRSFMSLQPPFLWRLHPLMSSNEMADSARLSEFGCVSATAHG